MQPVPPSAGKLATGTKHGKTCNLCQAQENMQFVPSAGVHETFAEFENACSLTQARENMQLARSTTEHVTCANRGEICHKGLFLIGLKIYKRSSPILTLFPLSPLLVNAKELSGNVQRPFGIPLRSEHRQKHRK